ncbi:uncharacterized protein LOC126839089 [Adelges cooleyi]|uniref:uncharacterized protein LOC126839089 n=1 Tax=Adelges cooleyi TaxID=133065 RepID=UPI00217F61AA|nr:uncharacterized protein LOC126839089 [Adelges cooleyi]
MTSVNWYKQTAACFVAALPVFMAGITLGWPSPVMEYMKEGRTPVSLSTSEISFAVACTDIGTFVAAVPVGRIMDCMGRKFTVFLSAPLMFAGWLIILFGKTAWCLYAARLLQGFAVSIAWVVSPSYIGEMASVPIRGTMGLLIQLGYATGLVFSYAAGWLLADYDKLALVSATVPILTGALALFIPESPHYFMLTNKPDEAARALWRLRSYTHQDLETELITVKGSAMSDSHKGTVKDLLNRDRRPLVMVIALAVLQMACGIGVLEAYAASLLSSTSVTSNACAVILGLVALAATLPFAIAVDRCGRRPLLIVSCLGTAVCHVCTAVCLATAVAGLPLLVAVCCVTFFINIGIMPLLSVVQCEYFPSDTRALADAAVVLVVTFTSTVMILTYQPIVDAFGTANAFVAYATFSLAGGIFCYVWLPETKCKTFVEIQEEFQKSSQLNKRSPKLEDVYEQICS